MDKLEPTKIKNLFSAFLSSSSFTQKEDLEVNAYQSLLDRFSLADKAILAPVELINTEPELSIAKMEDLFSVFKANQLEKTSVAKIADFLSRFKTYLVAEEQPIPQPMLLDASLVSNLFRSFGIAHKQAREEASHKSPGLNIWLHAGLGQSEVKHCEILAWFLDPEEDHSQGERFYHCLVQSFPQGTLPILLSNEEIRVRTEVWADDENRMDIEISSERFVVIIEAKISAPPDKEQLEIYWRLAKELDPHKNIWGIFLTPSGNIAEGDHKFRGVSWYQVANALRLFSQEGSNEYAAQSCIMRRLAKQYADYLTMIIKDNKGGEQWLKN